MEFPHLGSNCAFSNCNRLDFLPMKCGACLGSFCSDHFAYTNHECPAPNTRDVQVPECPLCGAPVPGKRGERPDVAVSEHIDNQCQSDPAKERRKKVYTNRCAFKGCKTKEMIPVVCSQCTYNYCLKHRHTTDHACEGPLAAKRKRAAEAAMGRLQSGQSKKIQFQTPIASNPGRTRVATLQDVQGNMSEDEALALALSLSLQGSPRGGDVAVARALARRVGALNSQSQARLNRPPRRYSETRDASDPQTHFRSYFDILMIVGAVLVTLYVLASLKYMFNSWSKGSGGRSFRSYFDILMIVGAVLVTLYVLASLKYMFNSWSKGSGGRSFRSYFDILMIVGAVLVTLYVLASLKYMFNSWSKGSGGRSESYSSYKRNSYDGDDLSNYLDL